MIFHLKVFVPNAGRDTNRFETFEKCVRGANGIFYITEGTNAYISVTVNKTEDLGSHTMFIGEITDMEVLINCGYEYVGEELPDDFTCPLCSAGKDQFSKT